MTKTTKILCGAALLVGVVVVYRRSKTKSAPTTATATVTGAARSVVDSGKAVVASVAAFVKPSAPAELGAGGTTWGTPSSTDVARVSSATRFVQASEVDRTRAQNVLLGLDGNINTRFRA